VNDGFSTLRQHIPHLKNKTSKVDTLRAAVDYIRQLRCLLGQPLKDEHLHRGPVLITDGEERLERFQECFIMFQKVSERFRKFQNVSESFRKFQKVSESFRMLQKVLECFSIFQCVSELFQKFLYFSDLFRKF
jgi:hypothetical protein